MLLDSQAKVTSEAPANLSCLPALPEGAHVRLSCLCAQDCNHPGQLARALVLFVKLPNLASV